MIVEILGQCAKSLLNIIAKPPAKLEMNFKNSDKRGVKSNRIQEDIEHDNLDVRISHHRVWQL